jgi:pilus assembly protein CpaE
MHVALVGNSKSGLQELLNAGGAQVTGIPLHDGSRLTGSAKPFDVVVVDVRGEAAVPSWMASIKRQMPDIGIVLVASALDPSLLLDAMRAGVNEVLAEPVTQADLDKAIAQLLGQRAGGEVGQVFGFIGAKGGIGATTIAINTATALGAMAKPARVLFVDLHPSGGDAALFLGVEPRFSFVDALTNVHRLDRNLLRSLVTEVAPGTDLLAAPEQPLTDPLDRNRVRSIVDIVAQSYKYTMLDLSRADLPVLEALEQLTRLFVVVNQDVAAVRSANRMALMLRQRYGKDKVQVILSRSDPRADIGAADLERAIGSAVAHTFPSDYRVAVGALNKGRPLALDNHNDLSASFRRFAHGIAGTKPAANTSQRSSLFGRFANRG